MLDVHPPHEPTHSWKDFWIHLGTITIGLLIAISLEQSVEALHRLHERHDLETSLHEESELNKVKQEIGFEQLDGRMAWLLALHSDIATMIATDGKARLVYRPWHDLPRGHGFAGAGPLVMSTAVWESAKSSQKLTLLTEDEGRGYASLYNVQEERYAKAYDASIEAWERQIAFELNFAEPSAPLVPVLSRMDAAELREYARLIAVTFEAVRAAKRGLKSYYGVNLGALRGTYEIRQLTVMMQDAAAAHPDTFGQAAK